MKTPRILLLVTSHANPGEHMLKVLRAAVKKMTKDLTEKASTR